MKDRTYLLAEYLKELWKTNVLPKDAEAVKIVSEVLTDIVELQKHKSDSPK